LAKASCAITAATLIGVQPGGYASEYRAPSNIRAEATSHPITKTSRGRVNALVDQLASLVAERAPVVGTHREGNTTITDHVLDRSKFDSAEIARIADSIGRELDGNNDADGFTASAYFNAKLMSVSIRVVNGLKNGTPIDDDVAEIDSLSFNPRIERWISSSRFQLEFADLRKKLRRYHSNYRTGFSVREIEQIVDSSDVDLKSLKTRMGELRETDVDAYNSLVPEYNQQISSYNDWVRRLKVQHIGHQKLDLAFNKCLDPGILMSKFQNVQLTSHAAEINNLPDQ
jgi:hypothetical protein